MHSLGISPTLAVYIYNMVIMFPSSCLVSSLGYYSVGLVEIMESHMSFVPDSGVCLPILVKASETKYSVVPPTRCTREFYFLDDVINNEKVADIARKYVRRRTAVYWKKWNLPRMKLRPGVEHD